MSYYIDHESKQVYDYPHTHFSSPLTREVLNKYKTDCEIFFETGTNEGLGIAQALDSEFQDIHSVEVCHRFFLNASQRYKSHQNVNIYNGNSSEILRMVLPFLAKKKILFWLDAWNYYSVPLSSELKEIESGLERKDHVFLINNIDRFGTTEWNDLSKDSISQSLLKINKNYSMKEEGNVLVATVP